MFVVDASVACKYVLNEPRWQAAESILLEGDEFLVPHYFFVETAHVLWRAVSRKRLPASGFNDSFSAIMNLPATVVDDRHLLAPAIQVALRVEIAVYDALYVALAQSRSAVLATSDDDLCAKLRRARLSGLRYDLV